MQTKKEIIEYINRNHKADLDTKTPVILRSIHLKMCGGLILL